MELSEGATVEMTAHTAFHTFQWWDRDTGRHNCVIHYGNLSVHESASDHDGYHVAEKLAWEEMACRLAQLGKSPVPESPPMSMGITP